MASFSEEALEGRVVAASGRRPLAGAIVSIAGYSGSARTDSDGRFSWPFAPTPPFQVVVVLASGAVMRPVLVERWDELLLIELNPLSTESVTVLGAAPGIARTAAAGSTLLSSAQVAHRSPENLMQALETVPGVSQVSEGHAGAPAVRGLARGRTLLLLDGARVSSERRVGPSASFLDPGAVGSIEVARGPASVAYGSDAFGGVISVKTRRVEPGRPFGGEVTGMLGAGVPDARGSLELSKGFARGGLLLQGHLRNAEDYDSPAGEVFNSGWSDSGILAGLTHELGRGAFAATWQSDFGRDFERPRNNSQTLRFSYPFENSHRLTASYDISNAAGLEAITLTGFVGTYGLRTDQDRQPTLTTGRVIERAEVSARDFQLKAVGTKALGSAHALFGVDVNGRFGLEATDVIANYSISGGLLTRREDVSLDRARRTDAGVFAQVEAPLGGSARLGLGARADRVVTKNAGGYFGDRATTQTAGSGFGSITLGSFRGVSATAQVSRGFRDPALSDRYYRGPSGRGFITGNPDLNPETSLQGDLALRYTHSRVQIALYGYHYRIDDLVERHQSQPDMFFFRNRGSARLRGVEMEIVADLGHGATVNVSAHKARGVALDDDAFLDDAPADALSLVARKEFGGSGWIQGRIALYADDDRPGPTEIAAPGHTIFDLGAGWKFTKSFELRLMSRNIGDEIYPASPDARFVLAPGRSISATATVRFR